MVVKGFSGYQRQKKKERGKEYKSRINSQELHRPLCNVLCASANTCLLNRLFLPRVRAAIYAGGIARDNCSARITLSARCKRAL